MTMQSSDSGWQLAKLPMLLLWHINKADRHAWRLPWQPFHLILESLCNRSSLQSISEEFSQTI